MPLPSSRLGWMLRQVASTRPATRAGSVNAKYAFRTEQRVRMRPPPVQRCGTAVPHAEIFPAPTGGTASVAIR
jgi:hypothetical protein